ncbi:allantoate amidohydrolase [Candidatus Pantoea edessiphila]|uniref:Allantoate amidohydrolase n=2 Tax=Candidatus Pantoea edessiphila TaxID=2044610 RepID=A0A2P5T1G8_9GAMM|nr:allantoate amidohydrolase [Candidatus Pantoea edessiphila]
MIGIDEAIISAKRVMFRCNKLAKITCMKIGITRLYLSPEHSLVNELVGNWMKKAGMIVRQDEVGNICGRYESKYINSPAIVLGSHLDTVRNAGRYDGILGVLTAIEIVYWLNKNQTRLKLAIEVIGFGDEEGTRFGITLLGSRGLTGTWKKEWLLYTDKDGITISEAMTNFGLDIRKIKDASRNIKDIVAYIEFHIEQGPCLDNENLPLGVVTTIHGARRFNCRFIGQSGHAGTVPMYYRKDALVAFAEWMTFVEHNTCKKHPQLVATVGFLNCKPGATNVIPGEVDFSLDIRGPKDSLLESLSTTLLKEANIIANNRKLSFEFKEYYRTSATVCDIKLQKILFNSIQELQGRCLLLPSGAGHDAIAIAECWPIGMLFIRNHLGISHNPKESINLDDLIISLQAYSYAVNKIINKI